MDLLHYIIFDNLSSTLNFRKTGKQLDISISMVSKKINQMEHYYDVRLFDRTSRSVTMTNEGLSVLPRIKELLLLEDQIKGDVGNNKNFAGNLKIGIPFTYLQSSLHKIHSYLSGKPNVYIDWRIGNHLSDLISDNFDAIIFCGPIPPGDYFAKKISEWKKVICASPDYIKIHGLPQKPQELINHQCIDHSENFKSSWHLDKEYSIHLSQKCSSSSLIAEMSSNSFGVCYLPQFTVKKYIEKGDLVEVLKEYTIEQYDVYLVSKHSFKSHRKSQEILNIFE